MIGQTLNERYTILDDLGEGASGVVVRARDTVLDREVAIKVLAPSSKDTRSTERFMREARQVANFKHPNIVSVHDFGEFDGDPYIVMELVEGETLAERMPVPLALGLSIGRQIGEALGHAHQHGVIHRDVKPENIIISASDGAAKLFDFGIAHVSASSMTNDGDMVGTIAYMSPEQVMGGEVDPRTDLYAFGVLLYELVTSEHPFPADNAFQIIHLHLRGKVNPPIELSPELPQEINDLILKLLEKRPDDRPQSMDEVLPALLHTSQKVAGQPASRSTYTAVVDPYSTIEEQGGLETLKLTGNRLLDPVQLSLIHNFPPDARFDEADLTLLFESVLSVGQDLDAWLVRARSPTEALAALCNLYRASSSAEMRSRLVKAIYLIDGDEAADVLVEIVGEEENHLPRSTAAVLGARRGRTDEIAKSLRKDIEQEQDPTALAAYVAIADEVGIPKVRMGMHNLSFLLLLAQRRWAANRTRIKRRAWRGAVGAGLFAIPAGIVRPLIVGWMNPEMFQGSLDSFSLPVWLILGGAVLFVIGMAQGYVTALLVGIADMISGSKTIRLTAGALAGLAHAFYLILFTTLGLFPALPNQGAAYVVNYLTTGLLVGTLLTLTIPRNLEPASGGITTRLMMAGVLSVAIVTGAATWLAYQGTFVEEIVKRTLFNALTGLGLGFYLSRPEKRTWQAE